MFYQFRGRQRSAWVSDENFLNCHFFARNSWLVITQGYLALLDGALHLPVKHPAAWISDTCDRRWLPAKKADVAEYPAVFDHVGLLVNKPPGTAGLPFS